MLISGSEVFLRMGLKNQLEEKGCRTIETGASLEEVDKVREPVDAVVLFLDEGSLEDQQMLIFLRDKAVQEDMPIFLVGDDGDQIDAAKKVIAEQIIQGTLPGRSM